MPAHRLPRSPELLSIPLLAVVGTYVKGRDPAVQHAALASGATQATFGQSVQVCHMGPPLGNAETQAHVAGWIGDLTATESARLRHWLHRAQDEMVTGDPVDNMTNRDYVIHPPYQRHQTEVPGRYQFRCSCAGLVLWAYERIGIVILNWRHPEMPLAQNELLRQLRHVERQNPNLLPPDRADWHVVNAGYLFHSLSRLDEEIRRNPYLPQSQSEISFP